MIGRPLSPVSFAGARRRGRRRGLAVGVAVGASVARSRGNQAQAEPEQYEAPDQVDTVAQLQQLAELKNQGVLTEEEFAAEKAKILG